MALFLISNLTILSVIKFPLIIPLSKKLTYWIPAVNIPNLQLIMPSSTLHQLTGGLKYLRDTLFIFKTFHLHESHYVLSPLQILHSSIFPPNFCALYLKFKFFAILLHRFSLFTPCYNLLFCLICHQLYHHTLHQRTVLSLYIFTSSKFC